MSEVALLLLSAQSLAPRTFIHRRYPTLVFTPGLYRAPLICDHPVWRATYPDVSMGPEESTVYGSGRAVGGAGAESTRAACIRAPRSLPRPALKLYATARVCGSVGLVLVRCVVADPDSERWDAVRVKAGEEALFLLILLALAAVPGWTGRRQGLATAAPELGVQGAAAGSGEQDDVMVGVGTRAGDRAARPSLASTRKAREEV
ncbi:hypothetical protein BJ912DRAFT_931769 [Pholiota molesta]|nr:hypothetical protein BJ912DRAFT_931769 [Pholiota molesta]